MPSLHCSPSRQEKQSGAKKDRTELQQCLKSLREDDILIVWKLDRLGRSLQHLIEVVSDLEERKIGFQSLTENIDTTSPTGKLIFHIFGSLAEFERGLIRERVKAGLEAAKKRGKKFGRPDALNDKAKEMALAMFNGGALKIDIARHFNVTRQTVYSLLKEVTV
jgi:DNA invertase Pin-like site-specific DNA recombinase